MPFTLPPLPIYPHQPTLTKPSLLEAVCITEFPDRFGDPRVRRICAQFPGGAQYLLKVMELPKAQHQDSVNPAISEFLWRFNYIGMIG